MDFPRKSCSEQGEAYAIAQKSASFADFQKMYFFKIFVLPEETNDRSVVIQ